MYPIKQRALVTWIVDGVHSWSLPAFLYLRRQFSQCSQNDQQVANDAAEPQGAAFPEPLLYGSEVKKTHSSGLCLELPSVFRSRLLSGS